MKEKIFQWFVFKNPNHNKCLPKIIEVIIIIIIIIISVLKRLYLFEMLKRYADTYPHTFFIIIIY